MKNDKEELTNVICFRQVTPEAAPHSVLPPVDVAVVFELAVTIPNPEQHNHQNLPYNPEEDDLLAVLFRPTNQAEVGQETDDRRNKSWTCNMV